MKYFDDKVTIELFREWRTRMQKCKAGEPLYSGHVSIGDTFDINIQNQLNIIVDRLADQIEPQKT